MPEEQQRLEVLRFLCDDALERVRQLSDLLADAVRRIPRDESSLDDAGLDRIALEDVLLLRAARRGLTLADIERAYVRAVLRFVRGNKSEAARRLGINRRTLQRRLGEDIDGAETDVDDGDIPSNGAQVDARVDQR
jgi:DNA-binding NtrC family response regulator